MALRKSDLLIGAVAAAVSLFCILFVHGGYFGRSHHEERIRQSRSLVTRLGLTDLCLFTEARYTRNPSQADIYSAFQDNPMGFDMFPSGSFVPPPFFDRP